MIGLSDRTQVEYGSAGIGQWASMMRRSLGHLMWGSVVVVVAALASHTAFAQVGCLQSLKITKPNATIPGYPWLPGSTPGQAPLSCLAAEAFRERVYVENKPLIDGTMLANRDAFLARATADAAKAEAAISDLEAKIRANDVASALVIAAEVVYASLAKAGVIASCLLPDPGPEKLVCAGLVGNVVITFGHILSGNMMQNEFAGLAAAARQDQAKIQARLAALKSTLRDSDMPKAQEATLSMFGGMCRAVQQNCL